MAIPSAVSPDVTVALKQTSSLRHDAIGNRFHTFRIKLAEPGATVTDLVSQLVDHGWHILGPPLIVEAVDDRPRHLMISMMQAEPRPIEVRASLNLEGRFEAHGEVRGEARP